MIYLHLISVYIADVNYSTNYCEFCVNFGVIKRAAKRNKKNLGWPYADGNFVGVAMTI
jgi:hypothetical protein